MLMMRLRAICDTIACFGYVSTNRTDQRISGKITDRYNIFKILKLRKWLVKKLSLIVEFLGTDIYKLNSISCIIKLIHNMSLIGYVPARLLIVFIIS